MASDMIKRHALNVLQELMPNEDWHSQDMVNTAMRWCKMMEEMSNDGKGMPFEFTTFKNPGHDELVLVKDIEFASLCAHHLLPFFGRVHVAYVPNGTIVGLSKIPRLVHYLSKGTWTQEGLTQRIANFLEEVLDPIGVAVVMPDTIHTCMKVRGIKERMATTTTSAMKGCFADHERLARAEFLALLAL